MPKRFWCGLVCLLLVGCSQDSAQQFRQGVNQFRRDTDPQFAHQQDYDRVVKDYQICLGANQNKPAACEGQKAIMDAAAQANSAPNLNTSVYVNH